MELITTIAMLCQMNWITNHQLDCQKYYLNCVDKTKKGIEKTLLDDSEKEKLALKVCIKTATIRALNIED